ncbi:uncharacterized protein LOC142369012 isoform X4 [Odontesthes bonariensis]|uniref:uncharacterized protein LOC142369012 isoform X4 n=1 Tax=Odontesthes bonariensis TaxID=219752 RepID=UPI003F58CC90
MGHTLLCVLGFFLLRTPIDGYAEVSIKATVILQPSWAQIYSGETVTARCEIQGGGGTQWMYEWRRTGLNIPPTSSEYRISRVTDSGGYSCRGRRDQLFLTQWSDVITVTVSADKPQPVLTVSPSWLSPGASVTLSCQVEHPSAGWRFYWYKAVPDPSESSYSYELLPDSNTGTEHGSYIIHGQTHTAGYVCRAGRGDPVYYTDYSHPKFVWSADLHPAASLTVSPDRVQHFTGDPVSLNCEGKSAEWRVMGITETGYLSHCSESVWGTITGSSCNIKYLLFSNAVFWCESGSGEFSNAVNITGQSEYYGVILVSPVHPVTEGGSVSLSCRRRGQNTLSNVFFYHNDTLLQSDGRGELNISAVSQSDEGFYKCEHSGEVSPQSWISVKVSIKATVILQPSWAQIYSGETVTARCEIQGGGGTQWMYEWRRTGLNIPPTSSEYRISRATDSGGYSCRGRRDQLFLTQWSDVINVTVSADKPWPVLTVSPSWLSPGASVTLSCQVEHPSAGWRFYWYKAVPDASESSYSYELLPDSNTGTEHGSYIIHGQTHTAGYVCRAGRGDPVYYTDYSHPEIVWSADLHPVASLTVSPDRVQHFTGDPVSLNCEGKSAEWRVMGITETGYLYYCSESVWGTMTGSSCNIEYLWSDNAVFWCESGSGEFSNAVNITGQKNNYGLILVSPVHPVTEGGSVSLSCRRRGQNTLSNVFFYHNDTLLQSDSRGELNISAVSQSDEGFYKCEHSGEVSPQSWISVKVSIKATVILQPSWAQIYSGETVTARCEIQGGGGTQWMYEWTPAGLNIPPTSSEYRISRVTDSGGYSCRGRRDQLFLTQWSDVINVTVSADKARPVLTVSPSWLSPGASVTLSCQVEHPSAGWRFYWYKAVPDPSESPYSYELLPDSNTGTEHGSYIIHGQTHTAGYVCRAGRGDPVYYTDYSDPEFVWSADLHPAASLTVSPDRVQHFRGDPVSLNCEGKSAEWRVMGITEEGYLYYCSELYWATMTGSSCNIENLWYGYTVFWCESGSGEFSNAVNITGQKNNYGLILVSPVHPVTEGGSVSLSCRRRGQNTLSNVFFYHNDTLLQSDSRGELNISAVSQSDEGFYKCEHSGEVSPQSWISVKVSIKATVILQPSWAQIYSGETVTARCEIQGGGGTQWMYEWTPAGLNIPPTSSEYRISRVTDSGGYSCRGRRDQLFLTQWSDVINVTVSDKARPVLTVSPSWLSPGASVTLSCQVEHPSAGWRFYWYKAVPDPSESSYSYELLPDSNTGTEHGSYIIHGQTRTAGYVCRAGRGDPVYYTDYSDPEFVWSADLHPAASLTVSPDRVQHFRGDPVSLNCEGKSAEWRVMGITEEGYLSYCSYWGTMTGSSCNIENLWYGYTVFWCESGSGEFSNAVNITVQSEYYGVILVSPVHPVTEGGSVSLSCRRRGQNTLSNVFFYHNDTLLLSDGRGELNISAVSQSDEGFYKCEHSGNVSSQSWISVKAVSRPEGSSFPVLMVVGPIIGLIFIVLLLLLCRCRRSKGYAIEQTVNQDETQQQVYSSLLHGDLCVYETVRGGEASADGQQEGDYTNVPSVISPTIRAGGENMMIRRIEEDGSDYYNVNPDSTAAMKPQ